MREIFFHGESTGQPSGLPPRVREGLGYFCKHLNLLRITPAYAGRTAQMLKILNELGDHPRICGKDVEEIEVEIFIPGSPPRVRE